MTDDNHHIQGAMSQTEAEAPTDRAAATRAAIEAEAERLFHTIGYQKTTVADIARALGMSPANVYRFFPSKAAINEAICTRLLNGMSDLAWSIARRQTPAAGRLTELFVAIETQTKSLFFNDRKMHDMVAAAMQEHWPVIASHIRAVETAIRHIIMDGQAAGDFARLDPERAAKLVQSTTIGFSHPEVIAQCAEEDFVVAAEAMAGFCLRALRRGKADD
jgi:AcrR family transcriptional regulator